MDLDLGRLRRQRKPEELIGSLATSCGLLETYTPISAQELSTLFSWEKLKKEDIFVHEEMYGSF